MADIEKVEGIGPAYAATLKAAGVATTGKLLEQGGSPNGRKAIAEKAGLDAALVLRWVNHVDLFRVKGIGEQYADLLEAAGVDTVPELAKRDPAKLAPKLAQVNAEKKLVRQLPSEAQVRAWVDFAKTLPRAVTY
jgi:predicted flap endonuclease-1-like 5' DNA nuclease